MDDDITGIGVSSLLELLVLAALWGGSFLLLRVTAPVFGPVFLIGIRVLMGLVVLLPILFFSGAYREFTANWRNIAILSLLNMCLPFCLIAYAAVSLGAGTVSILNATVPFFAAAFGYLLFRDRLSLVAIGGLVIGFSGVLVLMQGNNGVDSTIGLSAFLAGLLAASCYGFSTHLINRNLAGVSGMAITAGSLVFSSLYLSPILLLTVPEELPGPRIWAEVFILGTFCTGLPYLLFYRLVMRIGAYRTLTVTYLVPVFSIFYGVTLLGETVTAAMAGGSLLVLAGIAVTTGRLQRWFPSQSS